MNILNPNHTTHNLKIIPRFYPEGDALLELNNPETKTTDTFAVIPVMSGGYMYLSFEGVLKEGSFLRVKLMADGEVVYRGRIFVTGQADDTQNYKTTKDLFIL
ncbi:hypothetical protein OGH69_16695 [Flavobacterium sp. MFBS3-15]|uniref:hypothetical protein n=1 Tax=Flavobacterium sp. MFBS3-15 TaxID=2989816 RepID=UPI002236BCBD|nr:hypothetical protein [Flavobacterium sp. MFBS3-15]MCW4470612.1 hypothetical protein [Flavobacterium sp. MFBS3-15]